MTFKVGDKVKFIKDPYKQGIVGFRCGDEVIVTQVNKRDVCVKDTNDSPYDWYCDYEWLELVENSKEDVCKHLSKRPNFIIKLGKREDFYYCPDCKQEV